MRSARAKKAAVLRHLLRTIHAIRNRMRSPQVRDVLLRCAEVAPAWTRNPDAMPGYFPCKNLCPVSGKPRHIVLYEVKRAVALFWQLMATDEAPGLSDLLERLDRYACEGWEDGIVVGAPDHGLYVGYWLSFPRK